MRVKTAQQFVVNLIMSEMHTPLMIIGTMGIGKTWLERDAAEIANKLVQDETGSKNRQVHFIDLRLATQEPGDIIGLPRIDPETGKTIWSKPVWWPEEGTRGLLHLDELNRAPIDVRQAIFQLVQEWKMHTHKLPDGWVINASINPDNGDYQVETLDQAMLRRFVQIKLVPDHRDWLRWAEDYGIRPQIIKFVRENKEMLYKKEKFEITAYPSPEGYRIVDELLEMDVIPNEDSARLEVLAGTVGTDAAGTLSQYLIRDIESCVTMQEILDNYPKVAKKVKDQTNDRMNKTLEEFIVAWETEGAPDKGDQSKNFLAFLKELDPEWITTFLMAVKKNTKLLRFCGEDRDIKRYLLDIRSKVKES